MNTLKTSLFVIPSMVRWLVYTVLVYLFLPVVFITAPIVAMFVYKDPKDGNYYLPGILSYFTTHDTFLNVYWVNGYKKKLAWFHRVFEYETFDKSRILRWIVHTSWIWRNPGYKFKDSLGYNQKGLKILYKKDGARTWDSGHPSFSFWIGRNEDGKYAFMLQYQLYYYKQMCVEFYLGWKLFRMDEGRRTMIATRVSPFRKYSKMTEEDMDIRYESILRSQERSEKFWETGEK